jgi:uncharacterized protein YjbI with pentapeptide repeats
MAASEPDERTAMTRDETIALWRRCAERAKAEGRDGAKAAWDEWLGTLPPRDSSEWSAKAAVDFSGVHFVRAKSAAVGRETGSHLIQLSSKTGVADFSDFTFPARARFTGAKFWRGALFSKARFCGSAEFEAARFNGVGFADAKFSGYVRFDNAKIFRIAVFWGAKFSRDAHFTGTKFLGNTDFHDARFSGIARFGGTNVTFSSDVSFRSATFSGPAEFLGVTFKGDAFFGGATFSHLALFEGAKFSRARPNASCRSKREAASRSASGSPCEATFDRATFSRGATFARATFAGNTSFGDCTFSDETFFGGAVFGRSASFYGIQAGRAFYLARARFNRVPDFIQAHFDEPPRLDHVTVRSSLAESGEEPFARRLAQGTWKRITHAPDIPARYRALRRLAIQANDGDRELAFFAGEIRSARFLTDWPWPYPPWVLKGWVGFLRFWVVLAYDALSGIGRSVVLPVLWWLLVTAAAALFYLGQTPDVVAARAKAGETGVVAYLHSSLDAWRADQPCWPGKDEGRGFVGLTEPARSQTRAAAEAFQLALRNGLIVLEGNDDAAHRTYGCLYGLEGNHDSSVPFVPPAVSLASTVQKLVSGLLIFLFGLSLRNMLKMK